MKRRDVEWGVSVIVWNTALEFEGGIEKDHEYYVPRHQVWGSEFEPGISKTRIINATHLTCDKKA